MDVLEWLMDSDPALRWQVLRDLVGSPDDEVARERSRVAVEGWGAGLLALQDSDGQWDGGVYRPGWAQEDRPFFDAWTATHFALILLRLLGADPVDEPVRKAIERVADGVSWGFVEGDRYFDGEVEPCINGLVAANGAYFGNGVDRVVELLLEQQLADGGWNCDVEEGATVSSFHTTICVLEGLLEWELAGGSAQEVTVSRRRGEEYLLQRRLFRHLSDGEVVDPRFALLSFPAWWYYDILRALDYFRAGSLADGSAPDPRLGEAVDLLAAKGAADGIWRQENQHKGPTLLRVESGDGSPSRWNTLRALRVLGWWRQQPAGEGIEGAGLE